MIRSFKGQGPILVQEAATRWNERANVPKLASFRLKNDPISRFERIQMERRMNSFPVSRTNDDINIVSTRNYKSRTYESPDA